jgi:hypothetical protein
MGKTYKRNQQFRPKKNGKVFSKEDPSWKKINIVMRAGMSVQKTIIKITIKELNDDSHTSYNPLICWTD